MIEKNLQTYDVLVQVEKDGLKQVRAAELLGVSERHFRRLLKAYREKGILMILPWENFCKIFKKV